MAAEVLIAGAGPTGLAAALFLHERGIKSRIFDKADGPSQHSKALAVNPRTLGLLAGTGVSARIEAEGRPIRCMTLTRERRPLVEITVADVDPDHSMTVIPQAKTEALLREALKARGIEPEWNCGLAFSGQDETGVEVRMGEAQGSLRAPLLFAADGAHSTVRKALGLSFDGSQLPEAWELADVVYEGTVDQPEGFVDFEPHGFVFALAFDDARTRWRYISTVGDPVLRPPGAPAVKDVPWRSSFKIRHRLASALSVGRVALGGDAEHLHSPMGARGMNLGIEDAYVFAACAADALKAGDAARLADYGRLRHAADKGVVRRIETMTRIVRGRGAFGLLRGVLPPLVGRLPPALHTMRNMAVGLDHEVRLS